MPTSAAFFVIGRSGKMRTHTLAVLPAARVSARRAASIWFEVMRACVIDFKPYAPKATVMPRVSGRMKRFGFFLPVCHLRCFAFFGANIQLCALFFLLLEYVAAVDPHLYADDAVRKVGDLLCKIDVGAKCLKRNATTFDLFLARHFGATKTTGNADANSLHVAVGHDLLNCLLEDTAEGLALLQSLGDHVRNDWRLRFRRANLFNIDSDSKLRCAFDRAHERLDLFGELLRTLSTAANDEARSRGLHEETNGVLIALNFNGGDVHAAQTLLEEATYGGIDHHVGAIFERGLGEPARFPVADDAEAVCVWVYGVCHSILLCFLGADFLGWSVGAEFQGNDGHGLADSAGATTCKRAGTAHDCTFIDRDCLHVERVWRDTGVGDS